MAFSYNPKLDTYSKASVSLFREIALRDGGQAGKDEDYLNVFMESVRQNHAEDKRKFVIKRAGAVGVILSGNSYVTRGMFFWETYNRLIYCFDKHLYILEVATGAVTTLSDTFTTTAGEIGFTDYLYEDGTVKVVITDGTKLITLDKDNVIVVCSDTDLPSHTPNPIYLDGYVFLIETTTGKIFNSELNDPLSWTADAFILPEQDSDRTTRIAKVNNYLVAFGTKSVEYYWDAANAAPDSPMQRNDSPIKYTGLIGGLAQYGNTLIFVGKDAGGQADIYKLAEFKIEPLGTASVSRYLNKTETALSSWKGHVISMQGHTFYALDTGNDRTWVIDLDTGLTTRWAFQQLANFPFAHAAVVQSSSQIQTYFSLVSVPGIIYKFDSAAYTDGTVNFTCIITTENDDFDTLNRKQMGRLGISCDRPVSDTSISISWSDNDYKTWTTPREVNLNADTPFIYRLGIFRNRVFKFSYTDTFPLRITDVEVLINKGNN